MEINENYNPWYYYIGGKLIKEKKPIIPGEYIHTNSHDGCYRVYDVQLKYFTVIKDRQPLHLQWDEFRCKKGQGVSQETAKKKIIRNIESIKIELDSIKKSISYL